METKSEQVSKYTGFVSQDRTPSSTTTLVDCDTERSLELSSDGFIRLNGTVIVPPCLHYSNEYVQDESYTYKPNGDPVETDKAVGKVEGRMKELRFFPSVEGSLIRLYCAAGEWLISTNRKLNAFASYWCSRSFGELFVSGIKMAFNEFVSQLNPKYVYYFLIQSNDESQMVCLPNSMTSTVYHVGTIVDGKFDFDVVVSGVEKPTELTFDSYKSLVNHVETVDIATHQGVIAFDLENNKQIKLVNQRYHNYMLVRGNNPDYVRTYYQLLGFKFNSNSNMYTMMYKTSSNFKKYHLDMFMKRLTAFCTDLTTVYTNRYIKKMFVQTTPYKHYLLKNIHTHYLQTKEPISTEMVFEFVTSESFDTLNAALNIA